jgi:hypothetical protein
MSKLKTGSEAMRVRRRAAAIAIGLLSGLAATSTLAQESNPAAGCASYDVDVSTELALLEKPPVDVARTSAGDQSSTELVAGRAYALQLALQAETSFLVPPGRRMLDEGAFAGVARFAVSASGTWRISLDRNSWVDVVAPDGSLVESSRFGGRTDCPSLRKLVEFPLQPGLSYTLQLSGGTEPNTMVLITGPIEER